MPNKEQMLQRHEANIERLEYELGLFTSSAFVINPADLKDSLAKHVSEALEGERRIVAVLKRLESHSSKYTR